MSAGLGVVVECREDPVEDREVVDIAATVEQEPISQQVTVTGSVTVEHRTRIGCQVDGDHHLCRAASLSTEEPAASAGVTGAVKHRRASWRGSTAAGAPRIWWCPSRLHGVGWSGRDESTFASGGDVQAEMDPA